MPKYDNLPLILHFTKPSLSSKNFLNSPASLSSTIASKSSTYNKKINNLLHTCFTNTHSSGRRASYPQHFNSLVINAYHNLLAYAHPNSTFSRILHISAIHFDIFPSNFIYVGMPLIGVCTNTPFNLF